MSCINRQRLCGYQFYIKTACLYILSDFRDTFPKKVFYVMWWKNMLKVAIWLIPGVSESHFWISGAVFLKTGPKCWNLEILPFFQNYGWNGQKNHQKQGRELKYLNFRPWSWKIGETAIFRVFRPKLTFFDHGPIYLGWATRNSDFWLKSSFSLIKVDKKAKK